MTDSSSLDLENLNIQCVLDKVSITLDENDTTKLVGTGHLTFFINENPVDKEVLAVRFSDDEDNEQATIILVSTSTAWLESENVLAVSRPKGGVWKIDCSQSDEKSFKELLDILAFFIVFENRNQMRNMLVMIDPETCEVVEVVAKDVQLESVDNSGNVTEGELAATEEDEKEGEKLPVIIEDPIVDEETEVPTSRRVRILNRSANALLSGSAWISNSIIQGGDAVAKQISSGGQMLENYVDATEDPIKISDSQKGFFESAYNHSNFAKATANELTEKAASTTISTVGSVTSRKNPEEQEDKNDKKQSAIAQLGKSALLATSRVLGSMFKAKCAILNSSRESVVQVVHKKYGEDASLVVDRTLGTGYNLSCMMVYFDAKGVSRRVATKGAIQTAKKKKEEAAAAAGAEVKAETKEEQAETEEPKADKD
ncbi:hypothetical protein K501DRAFT_269828 [Backusella circina FSU 941]|nr:hypothetical protein K501DRAFT_269828 [Backusella circina FSU 941]